MFSDLKKIYGKKVSISTDALSDAYFGNKAFEIEINF
jgi:hypothetical protein